MTGFEKLGIGPDKPPKLILDFCWNHEGSIGRIRQMLQALRDTLTPEQYALIIPKFQAGRDLPWDRPMYRGIKKMCEGEFGLPFLCTAFDYKAVDMLDSLDVDAIKIGSAEAESLEFCDYAYKTGRAMLISTGGLDSGHIISLHKAYTNQILMHCVSKYPAHPEDLCLGEISGSLHYSSDGVTWNRVISRGYSSHYPGSSDAVFAMALGADVIEKHYSDKYWRGVDQPGAGTDFAVSIGPADAAAICQLALDWHKMRGCKSESTLDAERALLKPFRERFYANNHPANQDQGQAEVGSGALERPSGERLSTPDA